MSKKQKSRDKGMCYVHENMFGVADSKKAKGKRVCGGCFAREIMNGDNKDGTI